MTMSQMGRVLRAGRGLGLHQHSPSGTCARTRAHVSLPSPEPPCATAGVTLLSHGTGRPVPHDGAPSRTRTRTRKHRAKAARTCVAPWQHSDGTQPPASVESLKPRAPTVISSPSTALSDAATVCFSILCGGQRAAAMACQTALLSKSRRADRKSGSVVRSSRPCSTPRAPEPSSARARGPGGPGPRRRKFMLSQACRV